MFRKKKFIVFGSDLKNCLSTLKCNHWSVVSKQLVRRFLLERNSISVILYQWSVGNRVSVLVTLKVSNYFHLSFQPFSLSLFLNLSSSSFLVRTLASAFIMFNQSKNKIFLTLFPWNHHSWWSHHHRDRDWWNFPCNIWIFFAM